MPRRPRTRANGSGSVYPDGRRWRAAVTLPGGRHRTRTVRTRREAEQALAELLADLRAELDPDRPSSVQALAVEWLGACQVRGLRARTIELYEERLRLHIVPSFGELALSQVTARGIDRLYAQLAPRLAPRTILSVHQILYGLLRFAVRRQYLRANPAALVDPPRGEQSERARALTLPEARALLATIQGHQHGPLWSFLLATGCRFGEAAGLTWGNVDLDAGAALICQAAVRAQGPDGWTVVLAATKTRRSRRALPLPAWVAALLRDQRRQVKEQRLRVGAGWQDHDLVFPGSRGRPLRESDVLRAWRRMLRSTSSLPLIRMHDLRHTYATGMLEAGSELLAVQRGLGHASAAITERIYIGAIPEALRRAVDRWGDVLAPGPSERERSGGS